MSSFDYMLETPRPNLGNASPDSNLTDHEISGTLTTSYQCDFEDSCYDPERPYYNSSDIQTTLDRTTPYTNYNQIHMPDDQGYSTIAEKFPILSSAEENYMKKEMEKELNRINDPSSSTSGSSHSDRVLNEILMESGIIKLRDTSYSNVAENNECKPDGLEVRLTSSEAREDIKISDRPRRRIRNKRRRGDNETDFTENKKEIVKNNNESKPLSKSARKRYRARKKKLANKTKVIENRVEILKYFEDSNEIQILSNSAKTRVCDKEKWTTRVRGSDIETNIKIDVKETKNMYMKQYLLNKVHKLLCPQMQLDEIDLLQAMIEHLENCNK